MSGQSCLLPTWAAKARCGVQPCAACWQPEPNLCCWGEGRVRAGLCCWPERWLVWPGGIVLLWQAWRWEHIPCFIFPSLVGSCRSELCVASRACSQERRVGYRVCFVVPGSPRGHFWGRGAGEAFPLFGTLRAAMWWCRGRARSVQQNWRCPRGTEQQRVAASSRGSLLSGGGICFLLLCQGTKEQSGEPQ